MDNYKTLEYLEPQADGTFKFIESGNPTNGNQLIEIPEGAQIAYYFGAEYNHISFYKKVGKTVFVINPNYKDWKETSYKSIDEVPYQYVEGFVVWQRPTQDQGLISGAEAMIAALDDKEVEYRWVDGSCNWRPFNDEDWSVEDLKSGTYSFRLKPQTIKLELEIPAPYKAKIGGRDDTSFVLNVGRHQYLYQNEDDYTKARNALEAAFDAALGGNNS
ncbi:hypothetical protein [Acinetobacter sp. V115_6]|uniref:hypothetical protein n=1 Tax=Acinetobacter sp. V115_6 TaxID=3072987 RepID=UPI00287C4F51|nr:hypothetical protein [Acinetobacter sp. V115_6]MDS7927631.1 hypothetical protein [Acinetobacter sp. V115_6]